MTTVEASPAARDLTVVIPTLGREILRETLSAVVGGTVRPDHIVIVHQGEDDDVAQWLAELAPGSSTYVRSAERGRAAAVNRGLENVDTRFVAITDDDCIAAPDWVERMRDRLTLRPDALITGRVEAAGPEVVTAVVTARDYREQRRPALRFDRLSGGNMGAALAVLEKIGPLDEDPCLATAEDGEYAYRALRQRVPLIYDPAIVVAHYGWRGEAERLDQYDSYAKSLAGFMGKYVRRGDLFMALRSVVHLARSVKRWLSGVLSGDRERAASGRAYASQFVAGFRDGWRSGT